MNGVVLAFDTATSATAVALAGDAVDAPVELRDDPAPGARPGHAQLLLTLARQALDGAGLGFADVDRIVVGTGPGSFTGLRIGLATARALALGSGAEIAGVSTLDVLAAPAVADAGRAGGPVVAAVLDARRGEVFAQAVAGDEPVVPAQALAPERLAELAVAAGAGTAAPWLAVGDGAVRFRAILEAAGITIAPDDSPHHRVSALVLARLSARAAAMPRTEIRPDYLRLPDAELTRRARTTP